AVGNRDVRAASPSCGFGSDWGFMSHVPFASHACRTSNWRRSAHSLSALLTDVSLISISPAAQCARGIGESPNQENAQGYAFRKRWRRGTQREWRHVLRTEFPPAAI